MIIFTYSIFISAVLGFFVARYIWKQKQVKKPLMCPRRMNCHDVVNSSYSKFFGVSVESLGMLYYAFVVCLHVVGLVYFSDMLGLIMFVSSLGAFLFSIYLFFVQLLVIRDWCAWCLVSYLLTFTIFISSIFIFIG